MNNSESPKGYKGYTAKVSYRPSNGSMGVFRKASGWCYEVFYLGRCISAGGNLRSEEAAKVQAKAYVQWHMGGCK